MKQDDELDGDNDINNTLTSHLGDSIFKNSKRNINKLFKTINGLYKKNFYYKDTDGLYLEKKIGMFWMKLV